MLMMPRSLVLGALLVIAALAGAQNPAQKMGPVTHGEVNETLAKVEKAIGTLPGLRSYKPSSRATKPGVASRSYIIQELHRIFERVKPKFKFTPRKVAFDKKVLAVKPGTLPALQK